jgi:hypothetical protein
VKGNGFNNIEMFFMRLIVLILVMISISAERENITIGIIVNDNWGLPFGIYRSIAAIEMGVEKLRETVSGEADVNLKLTVSEKVCVADTAGASAAEMYYVDKVSAFIGPGIVFDGHSKFVPTAIGCGKCINLDMTNQSD